MRKKNWFKNLPLVLLAAAIALSPSFPAGEIEGGRVIELRVEDFLIVILGLAWITNFLISGREKVKKPPLFFPILAWLSVGLFGVLTNLIFANIALCRGFFFFLKQVQFFFLYFYLFYHIRNFDSAKSIVKVWIFLGLVNAGWIVFQLIKGLPPGVGAYGPGFLGEPAAPFPSGGFSLILFVFFLNILIYYFLNLKISNFKKGILLIVAMSPAIGVFASGSRASFLGLIVALILTFFFYSLKKTFLKSFAIGIFVLLLIGSVFIFTHEQPAVKRFLDIDHMLWTLNPENPVSRPAIWIRHLSEPLERPQFLFFGLGKSVLVYESHSQFVRNFVETGIIGSLIFLILMYVIIKKSWRGFTRSPDTFSIGLAAGLLVTTLIMLFISISAEAFIVVKIAQVYWFFAAITMAALSFNKTKEPPFRVAAPYHHVK